jgi:carbonate dehydratase
LENRKGEKMKKKFIYLTVLVVVAVFCISTFLTLKGDSQDREAHWSYSGSTSPEHWGDLSDDYKAAKDGKEQSPINITGAKDVDLPSLQLNSKNSKAEVENNGHTIEVKLKNKKNTLKFNGKTYTLEQFHFHAPSENQIDGKTYPLEGHFVYTTKDKKITVVSILYQYGKENKTLKQVWKKMPQKAETKKNLSQPVAISQLFPKDLDYYNFEGSLTTPPCTEGVNWIVFKKQENISKAQVKKFSKTLGFNNNRPIQKLNGREIKE